LLFGDTKKIIAAASTANGSSGNGSAGVKSGAADAKSSSSAVARVWQDEDDEQVKVDISATKRLRKLDKSKSKNGASGAELQEMLQDRFQTSQHEWAAGDIDTSEHVEGDSGKIEDAISC
jgi:hypothetical protein